MSSFYISNIRAAKNKVYFQFQSLAIRIIYRLIIEPLTSQFIIVNFIFNPKINRSSKYILELNYWKVKLMILDLILYSKNYFESQCKCDIKITHKIIKPTKTFIFIFSILYLN